MNPKQILWSDRNSTPPINYLWKKEDGLYKYSKTTRSWQKITSFGNNDCCSEDSFISGTLLDFPESSGSVYMESSQDPKIKAQLYELGDKAICYPIRYWQPQWQEGEEPNYNMIVNIMNISKEEGYNYISTNEIGFDFYDGIDYSLLNEIFEAVIKKVNNNFEKFKEEYPESENIEAASDEIRNEVVNNGIAMLSEYFLENPSFSNIFINFQPGTICLPFGPLNILLSSPNGKLLYVKSVDEENEQFGAVASEIAESDVTVEEFIDFINSTMDAYIKNDGSYNSLKEYFEANEYTDYEIVSHLNNILVFQVDDIDRLTGFPSQENMSSYANNLYWLTQIMNVEKQMAKDADNERYQYESEGEVYNDLLSLVYSEIGSIYSYQNVIGNNTSAYGNIGYFGYDRALHYTCPIVLTTQDNKLISPVINEGTITEVNVSDMTIHEFKQGIINDLLENYEVNTVEEAEQQMIEGQNYEDLFLLDHPCYQIKVNDLSKLVGLYVG